MPWVRFPPVYKLPDTTNAHKEQTEGTPLPKPTPPLLVYLQGVRFHADSSVGLGLNSLHRRQNHFDDRNTSLADFWACSVCTQQHGACCLSASLFTQWQLPVVTACCGWSVIVCYMSLTPSDVQHRPWHRQGPSQSRSGLHRDVSCVRSNDLIHSSYLETMILQSSYNGIKLPCCFVDIKR